MQPTFVLDIVKIFTASLSLSIAIKYLLPMAIEVAHMSVVTMDRIAIGILTGIPLLFLAVLWSKYPP